MASDNAQADGGDANVGPVPKDWIPGLIENWKSDLVAGIVIFLIALPLCIGIALASNAPAMAGIIAGFLGGMVISLVSGSYVTINGPAAGLIAITLGAVEDMGQGDINAGFRYALAAGAICGFCQIVLGFLNAGKLTAFFPLSVVHGMLAGIGVIIMVKQVFVALGLSTPSTPMHETVLQIIPAFGRMEAKVALLGGLAVLITVLWPMLKAVAKILPAALVAVLVTVTISITTGVDKMVDADGKSFLVDLPDSFLAGFTAPDFGAPIGKLLWWSFMYLFVNSLESLLTAAAVDKLDPWKRTSSMKLELVGKGIGNAASSLLGGLPMIAEVVRSAANIQNGARTRWANFFHGTLLLLCVAFASSVLEMIPKAALAGVLCVIGFRLAHPKEFLHALHLGKEEFFYMMATTLVVVFKDLLWGVIGGIILALIVNVIKGCSLGNLFVSDVEVVQESSDTHVVRLKRALNFGSYMGVQGKLLSLPEGQTIVLDYAEVDMVDHTVNERLHDFEANYARTGGKLVSRGKEHLTNSTSHPLSALVRREAKAGSPVGAS